MPQIIPRQFTAAPTNIQPGIGMAIGQGLQDVAGVAQQVEKGRREQDLLELKERERGERNAAINAMLEKQVWRQQYEYDVRQNHSPEEYLDALDKGESEYNESILAGKSEVFRDQFLNADKINRVQAMGVMGTTMQRDILDNEVASYESAMDAAIKNAIANGNMTSIDIVSESFVANGIIKKSAIEKGKQTAIASVNQGIIHKMPPEARIEHLNMLESSGQELLGVDIAKEKARAVTEYNTEQSISAIQNNSSKMEVASGLAGVFNNKTMNQQDAIDALDAMGMDKDSAPYIYGIGLIESQYDKKIGGMSAGDAIDAAAIEAQSKQSIAEAKAMMDEFSSGKSDLSEEEIFMRMREMSDTLQYRYDSLSQSSMKGDDKIESLIELRAIQEKMLAGMSNIKGDSIASQAIDTLKTVGSRRFFLNPVEEEIYRSAMLNAVYDHPQAFTVISDPDERTRAFREIEFVANLEVGKSRGLTGTPDEIVKQFIEQTTGVKVWEQNRGAISAAVVNRNMRIDSREDALLAVSQYLPGPATQDVIDAEVDRLMSLQASLDIRPSIERGAPKAEERSWLNKDYAQFLIDKEKAMEFQPSFIEMLDSLITPVINNPEYKPNYGNLGLTEEEKAELNKQHDEKIMAGVKKVFEFMFGSPFSSGDDTPESLEFNTFDERFGQ